MLRQELSPGLRRHPREAILVSPGDGARVETVTPIFRWDRVDANPPVTRYRLKIMDAGGATVFDERLKVDELPAESTYTLDRALAPGREYRWRIQVINSWQRPESDWSMERTLRVV